MIRRLALALALVTLPVSAHAYSITCNQVIAAAVGSDLVQGAVVGHAWGSADVLAGLLCVVGSPKCACLSNIVDRHNEAFAREYADEIIRCRNVNGNDPAFVPAMRAAQRVCS